MLQSIVLIFCSFCAARKNEMEESTHFFLEKTNVAKWNIFSSTEKLQVTQQNTWGLHDRRHSPLY